MFFDRHLGGERAVLVQLSVNGLERHLDFVEFEELVRSAGGIPIVTVNGTLRFPNPRTFVGGGKLREIESVVRQLNIDLIIFNHSLTPGQERNLEIALCCRVLARTGLILDIFAQRARTHEGKLQVELAQLNHVSTRLIRGWTHLERQRGGIGLRGPGETQLETDRRLIGARIKAIQARLRRVRNQREQSRRSRRRSRIPVLSLVGYTNAGKSTLFNILTKSSVDAADQLFATLDPTLASVDIDHAGKILIADTVGFISKLPTTLIEAFRATLEETIQSTLLLHVVDAASEKRDDEINDVDDTLVEIGAGELPVLKIFNKLDLLDQAPRIVRDESELPIAVYVSARLGLGINLLRQAISERLAPKVFEEKILLSPDDGSLRSALYDLGAVRKEEWQPTGSSILYVRLAWKDWQRISGEGLNKYVAH